MQEAGHPTLWIKMEKNDARRKKVGRLKPVWRYHRRNVYFFIKTEIECEPTTRCCAGTWQLKSMCVYRGSRVKVKNINCGNDGGCN
jgi:hypothetical protein